MTKNQFRTDTERYLDFIKDNFEGTTYDEKCRKMRQYADIFYELYSQGKISTCNPKNLKKEDIYTYQLYRRRTVKDTTILKDFSMISDLLAFVGNTAMMEYKAVYGKKKPKSYSGRKDPLPDEVIDKVYDLARKTDNWTILEGCVAIILGCAAGLRPQEIKQLYARDVHHLDPEPYVYVEHVKGEDKWGRKRRAPLNDGVGDIIEKYLQMRQRKLEDAGMMSEAMFPPFRAGSEFVTQQSMSRFKGKVQKALNVKPFELKDARRAYGQRMLDRGVPIANVSYCMGHDSIETTQKFYANYRESQMLRGVYNTPGIQENMISH